MSEQIMNEIEMIRRNGLERFVQMVPEAMDELAKMLNEPMVPSNVKAQLIQMILDRGLGKAVGGMSYGNAMILLCQYKTALGRYYSERL